MADDTVLRSSLIWLAAIMLFVGVYTHSWGKMFATYCFGLFVIGGVLLPDWDFVNRDFSRWGTPFDVEVDSAVADNWSRSSAWTRLRMYPLRLILYTIVYGYAFQKWWAFVST